MQPWTPMRHSSRPDLRRRITRAGASLLLLAGVSLGACSDHDDADPQAALVKRGEQVFQNNCTACHSRDPSKPGPVGPAIAGSPLALVEAKVLHNTYPPGYKPQRDTKAMIPLPHLAPELPAIAAYLQSIPPAPAGTP